MHNWFQNIMNLGLGAENGFFYRWNSYQTHWNQLFDVKDWLEFMHIFFNLFRDWKAPALEIMEGYSERTDGSLIDKKESSLVWHFRETDQDFGFVQAKELATQLESVLCTMVIRKEIEITLDKERRYVEIKPKNKNKGKLIETIMDNVKELKGEIDFILCIGDDNTDEEMFKCINSKNRQWKRNTYTYSSVKLIRSKFV